MIPFRPSAAGSSPNGRGPWCPFCKEMILTATGGRLWGRSGWLCRNCGWTSSEGEGSENYE